MVFPNIFKWQHAKTCLQNICECWNNLSLTINVIVSTKLCVLCGYKRLFIVYSAIIVTIANFTLQPSQLENIVRLAHYLIGQWYFITRSNTLYSFM